MSHVLRTERLSLRPCQISDLDAVHQLWNEADVRRFLFDDREISTEEAKSFIETSVGTFARHGYGIWLFFEHQRDQVAGFSGLLHSRQSSPSLIFGTRPQLWGRGYAKEATRSILRYAFNVLGLARVEADVDEPNNASIRLLEGLGMSRTRRAIVNERPLLYYEIQSEQKEARAKM
ncbi:GNAT family N-acetyltransferase [Synechococcus sp. PCC 6312]|uniref:GNAT family N-acetyltransferase n=1 Tax=Synechococcus sp. (strain ATCC 27167 / PCC 6312) TaxID=195253 RepID=UPI00029ED00E|nr:GNAT family N-acetyltransferase [Synechococcus sp. PCC 6312]AFY62548.1 acetyltransferase, ribosomal protein N-acetylase [Synechococcus sp. PCC 6312]